jgi:DNA-binding HxlR family transcriptional regulator
MVVREAFFGRRRYTDFVNYTGAQRSVVSDRLKRLVDAGIFERVEYQTYPSRHEYRLTGKGRDLVGVLMALMGWGDRWLDGGHGAPVSVTHTVCGHDAAPRVVCGHCYEELSYGDLSGAGSAYEGRAGSAHEGRAGPSGLERLGR